MSSHSARIRNNAENMSDNFSRTYTTGVSRPCQPQYKNKLVQITKQTIIPLTDSAVDGLTVMPNRRAKKCRQVSSAQKKSSNKYWQKPLLDRKCRQCLEENKRSTKKTPIALFESSEPENAQKGIMAANSIEQI